MFIKLILATIAIALCKAGLLPSPAYLPQASAGSHQHSQQSTFQGTGSFITGSEGNRRPQQEAEKQATIVSLNRDVSETGFHYDYKTSNGISAHESGTAQGSQGGFSYIGDDGITYAIDFVADKEGFRASGAHLPVAPPTPEAILLALQQNARDEAAGDFDNGQYHPQKHGEGQHVSGHHSSSSSSSSQSSFSNTHHQTSFNPNTGYQY